MNVKLYALPQDNKNKENKETNAELLVFRSSSVAPNYTTTTSQAIGIGGHFESDGWVSRAEVTGDIDTELTIDQFKIFLEGLGFKTEPEKSHPNNLCFTYKPSEQKYLTIIRDFVDDSVYDVAKSCLISSIKINTTLQAYVTGNVSVIGMDFDTMNGTIKPTLATHKVKSGALRCLEAKITENGNTDITSKVESIDITIDRKLEGKGALNSIYNKAINSNGKVEVSLNLQFNEFDKDSYKKAQEMLKNNTSYKIEVELVDSINKDRKIKIEFPKVKIGKVEVTNLESTGGLSKDMKAYTPDNGNEPFIIKIENYLKDTPDSRTV